MSRKMKVTRRKCIRSHAQVELVWEPVGGGSAASTASFWKCKRCGKTVSVENLPAREDSDDPLEDWDPFD